MTALRHGGRTIGEYLIQDPYHPYAIRLMRAMHREFGWRAICYYTDETDLRRDYGAYPMLQDPTQVAASYRVADSGMTAFIEHLAAHHQVRAVVPHYEPAVANVGRIAAGLGLAWNPPDVLERFRHKEALKAYLRSSDPGLRLNFAQVVSGPTEALQIVRARRFDRFVLKPNEGFGNTGVGIFDGHAPVGEVQAFWGESGPLLLEEFIGGEEYHCDGQVDAVGEVTVTDAFRYTRAEVNGRENIQRASTQVPHDSARFHELADYAARVVAASGLRRSPFHCEIKVDAAGPCLIECAARLVGLGTARVINFAHGGALDLFALAAHYYGTADSAGPVTVDWVSYDSRVVRKIAGIAERAERVFNLQGLAEVEARPEFLFWLKRLRVGDRLQPTVDLFGAAYVAVIQEPDENSLDHATERIQDLVRWNEQPITLTDRMRAATALGRRQVALRRTADIRRMPLFN